MKFIFLALFFIYGCVQQDQAPKKKGSTASSSKTATSTGTGTTTTSALALSWFNNETYTKSLLINANDTTDVYARGSTLDAYLNLSNNRTKNYCLVVTFSNSTNKLYARGTPITANNFANGTTERLLKFSFSEAGTNSAVCTPSPATNAVFSLATICPTCLTLLKSMSMEMYRCDTASCITSAQKITTLSELTGLNINVNPNNNSTSSNSACTNSGCQASGYSCCLENVCVNDGEVRPNALLQNSSEFQVAQQVVAINNIAFINYPQFYFICPNILHPIPTTSTASVKDTVLEEKIRDYNCINELKASTSASAYDPFHEFYLDSTSTIPSSSVACPSGGCYCVYDTGTATSLADNYYHRTVMNRLYNRCGCEKTSFTLEQKVNACPKYTYDVIKNSAGTIVDLVCITPLPANDPSLTKPYEMLNIPVQGRTIPHLFYRQDTGAAVYDYTSIAALSTSTTATQEGRAFIYADSTKLFYETVTNTSNMNAILGPISTTLSSALPAKKIDLDYGKSYIITVNDGFYTPCLNCGKDSWFEPFSAFPVTEKGIGVVPVGYSTNRQLWGYNYSLANWEDLIFGRACWVPPTMLPFSHYDNVSPITQRRNRLDTQAFLFQNGYQRDWFGFNKGAIIGSFDGVTWFAIGRQRFVQATSNKLFLAVNGIMGDVAEPNSHTVSVYEYDGYSTAAKYDWDPTLSNDSSLINEAASCQRYHQCTTDADCIGSLGWEYMCADVGQISTYWPSFSTTATEQASTSMTKRLTAILQGGFPAGSSTKRCVYRGAGAPCYTDIGHITSDQFRKHMSCAPNFFCAQTSNATAFNLELARTPYALTDNPTNLHLFGKDADVLGRPLNYLGGYPITTTASSNFMANMIKNYTIDTSIFTGSYSSANFGLCRPGKTFSSVAATYPREQQLTQTRNATTDVINQIGPCDTSVSSASRFLSCPVLDDKGNYYFTATSATSSIAINASLQNACGDEERGSTRLFSDFIFPNTTALTSASLMLNACYRRAGATCHTDLDCSPNRMHGSRAEILSYSDFGNIAEQKYWEEYLVCRQSSPEPDPHNSTKTDYYSYNMGKNKCCREIGKDLTIFTEQDPLLTDLGINPNSFSTMTFGYASSANNRYSRLAAVSTPSSLTATIDTGSTRNIFSTNQWNTIGNAAQKTCCGGGWIRKFADGTTNWADNDSRLSLQTENFKCLNYVHPMIPVSTLTPTANYPRTASVGAARLYVPKTIFDRELGNFCKGGSRTKEIGCVQYPVNQTSTNFYSVPPDSTFRATLTATDHAIIETHADISDYSEAFHGNFAFTPPTVARGTKNYFDYDSANAKTTYSVAIVLPAYMPRSDDTATWTSNNEISITLTDVASAKASSDPFGYGGLSSSQRITCTAQTITATPCFGSLVSGSMYEYWSTPTTATTVTASAICNFCYDAPTGVLVIGQNLDQRTLSVRMKFPTWPILPKSDASQDATAFYTAEKTELAKPGNTLFYLKKLARLELIGIPQIYYEPIYCSTDHDTLMPGIFKSNYTKDSDLAASANATVFSSLTASEYNSALGANAKLVTNSKDLQHSPVFSSSDFRCCSKLGTSVTDAANCCSGFTVLGENENAGLKLCALPAKTNLNVYFNRFVSGEGSGTDVAEQYRLVDADFDSRTGEPLLTNDIYTKLTLLGKKYCSGKDVRNGGAFGLFYGEPRIDKLTVGNSATPSMSVTDSEFDQSDSGNAGYGPFYNGFRWNHHLYCVE